VIRWTAALGSLALAAASQVAAQDARLTDRLSVEAAAAVQLLVDSAGGRGLPTETLVDLALEGAAKDATDQRIVAAVERLFGALVTAHATLGTEASASEITIAAYALRQGLSQDNLRQLRESRPSGDLSVPLGAALDLAGRGVTPDSATMVVAQLARRGEEDTIRRLVREVDRSLASGLSSDEAWRMARLRIGP
jgi:hypothetical protein